MYHFPVQMPAMLSNGFFDETRLDTRLPQSRVGGQEPKLWSSDYLRRSNEAKNRKNQKQVAQGQYVVSDTRCPALHGCKSE